MPQNLGFAVELPLAFNEAVGRVKELGRKFRPCVILGACNPALAFSVVNADLAVALLLPCNVSVESVGEQRMIVRLTNPEALLATEPLTASPSRQAALETPATHGACHKHAETDSWGRRSLRDFRAVDYSPTAKAAPSADSFWSAQSLRVARWLQVVGAVSCFVLRRRY